MACLSYRRHRFPPSIIQHAIWLYLRFTLSYRDVEELLAERGVDVSYETVRRWVLKFGPVVARRLRERRPRPSVRWHLDEMVVRIQYVEDLALTTARHRYIRLRVTQTGSHRQAALLRCRLPRSPSDLPS
jgi:transposase-like protein